MTSVDTETYVSGLNAKGSVVVHLQSTQVIYRDCEVTVLGSLLVREGVNDMIGSANMHNLTEMFVGQAATSFNLGDKGVGVENSYRREAGSDLTETKSAGGGDSGDDDDDDKDGQRLSMMWMYDVSIEYDPGPGLEFPIEKCISQLFGYYSSRLSNACSSAVLKAKRCSC
ncbi:hypothetical protein D9757_005006 [Collybiopsis confluens]|uniref:Uncharacterized protein n=1 Tax=Collybiopsis confluens TaxID=2823264 RepID=A0A8H5HTS7_9AGAR|nr:hypothetical protein D9757_005006 [Collybiopsis confluens]